MKRWFARFAVTVGLVLAGTPAGAQEEDAGSREPAGSPEAESPRPAAPQVEILITAEGAGGNATTLGTVVLKLLPDVAPGHVENFLKLVKDGYYDGTTFHRIVPGFIIQGGDPISRSDWKSPSVGMGGPDYTLPAEIGDQRHVRGAVAAARKPDAMNPKRESSGSQFFICLADLPALDRGGYTVFAEVAKGMDVVDKVARVKNAGGEANNRALQRVQMSRVRILP